jgi:ABC-2 type transport system ATP-binding protein
MKSPMFPFRLVARSLVSGKALVLGVGGLLYVFAASTILAEGISSLYYGMLCVFPALALAAALAPDVVGADRQQGVLEVILTRPHFARLFWRRAALTAGIVGAVPVLMTGLAGSDLGWVSALRFAASAAPVALAATGAGILAGICITRRWVAILGFAGLAVVTKGFFFFRPFVDPQTATPREISRFPLLLGLNILTLLSLAAASFFGATLLLDDKERVLDLGRRDRRREETEKAPAEAGKADDGSLLRLTDVTIAFRGGAKALDRLTLSLRPGLTVLLGANGAGKTTLLRVLAGLYRVDRGRYSVRRENHGAWSSGSWPPGRLGYLAQKSSIDPDGTVREAFLACQAMGADSGPPVSLEDMPELPAFADRKVGTLSGGERRRAELAILLSLGSDLLLLDEPTVGLDAPSRRHFREAVFQAATGGRMIVLSTHITEDVDIERTSRLLMLHGGRIVFDGAPKEAIARAAGKVFVTRARLDSLRACIPPADIIARRFIGEAVSVRFLCAGPPPVPAEPVEPTLEEAYLMLRRGEAIP